VVDDEQRENEGDLICAAQFATPEAINFMATEARGLICLAMEGQRLDELDLPLMVDRNTDAPRNCAALGTSFPCAPVPAACSNGPVTPKPPWIWLSWRASAPPE
jgi:3,4-dihydroxy-2-butanone 4-phosphate synthase